jgi:CubicO group peptidase (beta-lactamase class C family)
MTKKVKWIILSGMLGSLILGSVVCFLNGALPIGTGYSAKYLCSQVFLADRNPKLVFETDIKPTHFLFRPVTHRVDYERKTVTAKAFGFWKPMTAVYREGCGCTLIVDTTRDELLAQAKDIVLPRFERSDAAWPLGSRVDLENLPNFVDKGKMKAAVANAFAEPGPDTKRNTQAIVVVLGDQIIAEAYAPGFTQNTPLLGWSMSKSVTNALVGILVKDGLLDLHEPAPVDDWKNPGDPRGEITLDMMLRMSTGLEFEEVYGPFKDATNMLYASKSMADFASAKPLEYAPDTHWSYASGTANLLARIVKDKVGGSLTDFHRFSRQRLFDKIKAYSAVIEPDATGSLVGSSYMFATARDWARFGLLLKNEGVWAGEKLLPKGWVSYSTRPTPSAPMGQYGAQFWLNAGDGENPANRKFPTLPRDLYYCGGFNGQIVAVIPSRDLVVVRLGVTHDDSWDHETFIGNLLDSIRI